MSTFIAPHPADTTPDTNPGITPGVGPDRKADIHPDTDPGTGHPSPLVHGVVRGPVRPGHGAPAQQNAMHNGVSGAGGTHHALPSYKDTLGQVGADSPVVKEISDDYDRLIDVYDPEFYGGRELPSWQDYFVETLDVWGLTLDVWGLTSAGEPR